jgi:tetratricopeptide (TPR) repeat protein
MTESGNSWRPTRSVAIRLTRPRSWPEALAAFDRSLNESARNIDVQRLRGEVLLELKRLPEAIDAFTAYLKRAKDPQADAYRARGLAYASLGKYREATNDYTRALELDPKSANIHTRLGWAYLLKNYQLAEQDFSAAIAENPQNGDSWNGRGFARVKQGRHAEGVADAEAAVKAGPDVWPTYFNAAGIYAQALPALSRDPKLAGEEELAVTRDRYTTRAVELLKKAGALATPAEFAANLKGDEALDPLRDSEVFKALQRKP